MNASELLKTLRRSLLACEVTAGTEHAMHEAERAALELEECLQEQADNSPGLLWRLSNLLPGEEITVSSDGSAYILRQHGERVKVRVVSGPPGTALPALLQLVQDLSTEGRTEPQNLKPSAPMRTDWLGFDWRYSRDFS